MKSNRLLLLTFCVCLLARNATPASADAKIAVVDLQRALNETEDGRQAQKRLKSLFDKRQKELDASKNDLKAKEEQLQKQKGVLSKDAFEKKVEDFQQQYEKLQSQYMEYQQEVSAKESELTQKILEKMQVILRQVGQTEGYTLIVEANEGGVVWVPTNLDLTDILIQRYNQQAKSSPGSAPGKPAAKKPAKP